MLFIPHELIRNPDITNDELMTYCFVQIQTYSNNYDSCLFRVSDIIYQALGETNSHSLSERFSQNIKKLIKNGYLDAEIINGNTYGIGMSSFELTKEDGYVKVEADMLRTIMDDVKRGKSDALRYYLLIISSSNKYGVGVYERVWFANIMNVSEEVVSRLTKALEDLKLIYVYRAADFYTSNTYGLYQYKEAIDIAGKKRSKGRELSSKANEKRKYVAMYYSFLDGKEYPIETLQDIYEHLEKRNKEIADLGKRARGTTYDLTPLIDKIKAEC